jgi:hypothetical protein
LSGVIHDSTANRSAYGQGGSYAMNKVGSRARGDALSTMRSERSQRSANVVLKNANGQILVEKPATPRIGAQGIGMAVGTDQVVLPGHRNWRNSAASGGGGSSESHGSDAMIIKQTKEWSVTYEN